MKWLKGDRMRLVLIGIMAALVLSAGNTEADFNFGEPFNLESVIPFIDAAEEDIVSFSSDGLEMYIESLRSGGQGDLDIWVLRRNSIEEGWSLPENLGPVVNSPGLESGASISTDGLTMLFTSDRPSGHGLEDIYITTRPTTRATWEQAVNIGPVINSSTYDNYPCMSSDGLELYFSSMRSGGFGRADLWVSRRATTDDPWGEPENLGPMINSTHADMNPHLSPDGLVLLFSGHPDESSHLPGGYGGADIWMIRRQTLSAPWQVPVNIGPMVNDSKHNFIPRISPDGSTLYFVKKSGSTWENWLAPIIPVIDFNGDGIVDAADMCIMVDHWHTDYPLCDIGPTPFGDGVVDVEDLKVLAENLFEEVSDPTLIAHWPLDETEGMFAADSARDNDAFIVGGTVWQPSSGQVDGALQLNGVDGCAIAGAILNPADGPFSLLAWVNGGAPGQVVVSQQGAANWLSADPSEGKLMTGLIPPPVGRTPTLPLVSETIITDSNWHRIGFVWDGIYRTLYVDGVVVAQDIQDSLESSSNGLYIGAGKDMQPGTYFSGLIDDVRIYNRAVSP